MVKDIVNEKKLQMKSKPILIHVKLNRSFGLKRFSENNLDFNSEGP